MNLPVPPIAIFLNSFTHFYTRIFSKLLSHTHVHFFTRINIHDRRPHFRSCLDSLCYNLLKILKLITIGLLYLLSSGVHFSSPNKGAIMGSRMSWINRTPLIGYLNSPDGCLNVAFSYYQRGGGTGETNFYQTGLVVRPDWREEW